VSSKTPLRLICRALALPLLLAAGCASVAPPAAPERLAGPLPAAWSRDPGPAPGAPAAAFGDPLLLALVTEALAANTDVQVALAALAQARAQRDAVAAAAAPQLDASARAARNRSDERSANTLRAGLDASWEVDLFGARADATAAAQATADASAATLQATRLAVAGDTAIAYLQWQGTRAQLAVADESVASQAQALQLAHWRLDAGLASALDLAQASAALEQTRARVPALQTTLAQAENQLAVLLGQPAGTLAARLAGARAASELSLPTLPALGVPADLLRRRPDVLAAERRVAAALATLSQRQAERLPRFNISGSLALQAVTFSALGGPSALVAGIAAAVDWPLLDGGAGAAQVAAQQAALDGAQASYRAAVLLALQDVEDQLVALARGAERVAALARADAAAREALQLARDRYAAGLIDFGTLLDSERAALTAGDTLASARTDRALSFVRLYKGLGGDWGPQG
jgi:multidrug efflux system outer membrane protein